MTERFQTTWDMPDFDKDEWYDEELHYHQEQVASFVDAVREVYGEEPEQLQAAISTEKELVNDFEEFQEKDGGQVKWLKTTHTADKGMMDMEYVPEWSQDRKWFVNNDYLLQLDGSVADRNLTEQEFDRTLNRTGAYRVKDIGRWLK